MARSSRPRSSSGGITWWSARIWTRRSRSPRASRRSVSAARSRCAPWSTRSGADPTRRGIGIPFACRGRRMYALPPSLRPGAGLQVTGLACPDCGGVLQVQMHTHKGHLDFRCRIGHGYALPDLLLAREQAIEGRLRSALVAVEELAALLRDLAARSAECWPGSEAQCGERRHALEAYAVTLRRVIEDDRPLSLEPGGSEGAA